MGIRSSSGFNLPSSTPLPAAPRMAAHGYLQKSSFTAALSTLNQPIDTFFPYSRNILVLRSQSLSKRACFIAPRLFKARCSARWALVRSAASETRPHRATIAQYLPLTSLLTSPRESAAEFLYFHHGRGSATSAGVASWLGINKYTYRYPAGRVRGCIHPSIHCLTQRMNNLLLLLLSRQNLIFILQCAQPCNAMPCRPWRYSCSAHHHLISNIIKRNAFLHISAL